MVINSSGQITNSFPTYVDVYTLHDSLSTTLDLKVLENANFSDGKHDCGFLVVNTT